MRRSGIVSLPIHCMAICVALLLSAPIYTSAQSADSSLLGSKLADVSVAPKPKIVFYLVPWCGSYLVETAPDKARNCDAEFEKAIAAYSSTKDCIDWLMVSGHLSSEPAAAEEFIQDRDIEIPYVFDHQGAISSLLGIRQMVATVYIDLRRQKIVVSERLDPGQLRLLCT